MVKIIIPGEPIPKLRPRFDTINRRTYTPNKTKKFEKIVKKIASEYFEYPFKGPIKMDIVFCYHRPVRKVWKTKPMPREWKPTRPDWDNLAKSICDALDGVAYVDDGQIVDIRVRKYICSKEEKPHTEIIVEVIG